MTTYTLSAVDSILAWADDSVTADEISAYQNTLAFAQAAARAVNPDTSTSQYFDAMTGELTKLGWNITDSGSPSYSKTAEKIQPAAIVESILDPYLDAKHQAELDGLLKVVSQPDGSIKSFTDFWHRKSTTKASNTNMGVGPLTSVLNSPNITLVHYSFNFAATSEGWLFVEVDSASLSVAAKNLTMNLDMDIYNAEKDDLLRKLVGHVKDNIDTTKTSW